MSSFLRGLRFCLQMPIVPDLNSRVKYGIAQITGVVPLVRVAAIYLLATLLVLSVSTNVYLISKMHGSRNVGEDVPESILRVTDRDYILGDSGPTVIGYSDFTCPFCRSTHAALKQLASHNKIRWVFRQRPLHSAGSMSLLAAAAANCAGEQNHFWQFADLVFSGREELTDESLTRIAIRLGLNIGKFNVCRAGLGLDRARDEQIAASSLGINETPTLYIGKRKLVGAVAVQDVITHLNTRGD
jgi:protein-disulfide isomerase